MENTLIKYNGNNGPKHSRGPSRGSKSAKAMAVVTGGVLAVVAAVRVTTAQDASATTLPDATQPMSSTAPSTASSTAPSTMPMAFMPTTDPMMQPMTLAPTTQPLLVTDAVADSASTTQPTGQTGDQLITPAHVLNIQYNPLYKNTIPNANQNGEPTTAPYTPSSVMPGDATPGSDNNTPAHVAADPNDQPKAAGSGLVSSGTDQQGRITIAVNKSAVVTTRFPYKRMSIGQPDIADVNAIGAGSVLVTGKKAGTTQLILWDDAEHSQVIDVDVVFDMRALSDLLKSMFPDYAIEAKSLNGAVALRGRVPNAQAAEQVLAAATPFGQKVLNFLEIGGGQQVQLQVRIAEVSRTASSELGVNIGYTDGISFVGSNIGGINPFGLTGTNPRYFTNADPATGATTLFGGARFGRTAVDVFVDALRQNNLLRILAEPNLVAISGQAASFLAGGEYPIPVPQGSSGGVTTTIEYRDYGVRLNFVPIVLGDGRIRLKVAPEVSELDYAHAVNLNGYTVPGLTTRKVETCVELAEGQTFAIGGLLSNMQTSSKSVTPLLGDLPVIGALFRSVRYERQETELVVLVTPRLVAGMNPDKVPSAPGEHWHDPNELDLFLNRDVGGDTATTRPADASTAAPRYHGHAGYAAPATGTTATGSTPPGQTASAE